jgi:hypothetical protein
LYLEQLFLRGEEDEEIDFRPCTFEIGSDSKSSSEELLIYASRFFRANHSSQAGFHATGFGVSHEKDYGSF